MSGENFESDGKCPQPKLRNSGIRMMLCLERVFGRASPYGNQSGGRDEGGEFVTRLCRHGFAVISVPRSLVVSLDSSSAEAGILQELPRIAKTFFSQQEGEKMAYTMDTTAFSSGETSLEYGYLHLFDYEFYQV